MGRAGAGLDAHGQGWRRAGAGLVQGWMPMLWQACIAACCSSSLPPPAYPPSLRQGIVEGAGRLAVNVGTMALLGFGGLLVIQGRISVGALLAGERGSRRARCSRQRDAAEALGGSCCTAARERAQAPTRPCGPNSGSRPGQPLRPSQPCAPSLPPSHLTTPMPAVNVFNLFISIGLSSVAASLGELGKAVGALERVAELVVPGSSSSSSAAPGEAEAAGTSDSGAAAAPHAGGSSSAAASDAAAAGAAPAASASGRVEFEDVWFKYPGTSDWVVHGLNLTLLPGQTLALVGPSGGGKSTIAALLLGLYQPQRGRILVDGQPLPPAADGGSAAVGVGMAAVLQQPMLMAGTVAQQIRWGWVGGAGGAGRGASGKVCGTMRRCRLAQRLPFQLAFPAATRRPPCFALPQLRQAWRQRGGGAGGCSGGARRRVCAAAAAGVWHGGGRAWARAVRRAEAAAEHRARAAAAVQGGLEEGAGDQAAAAATSSAQAANDALLAVCSRLLVAGLLVTPRQTSQTSHCSLLRFWCLTR